MDFGNLSSLLRNENESFLRSRWSRNRSDVAQGCMHLVDARPDRLLMPETACIRGKTVVYLCRYLRGGGSKKRTREAAQFLNIFSF